ncbi:MAG TPA: cyclopropane-fatty-acyl-phospholipid synthase family protein [Puia sp.]
MDNALLIPRPTDTNPGAEFFRLFLDPTMTWSGAWFADDGMTLEQAQIAKYERLCSQLRLCATDQVLEVGSGWGGNAIYMARQYGCHVTTLTDSEEQYAFVTRRVKEAGENGRITVRLQDYRHFTGRFDKIVSVETLVAVSRHCIDTWFRKCREWLKRDGILALQVITHPDTSLLLSMDAINTAVHRAGKMTLVDCKDLSLHYAATLKIWYMQFNSRLAEIKALGFDDRFIRKWNQYFCYGEAAFRMRNVQLMQLVFAQPAHASRGNLLNWQ